VSLFLTTIIGQTTVEPFIETNLSTESTLAIVETQEIKEDKKTTIEIIEESFKDAPILIEVARCESQFRQFNSDGQVLRGLVNRSDVGVMQINEKYHAASAIKHNYDIYSLEGNLGYARYLYETQGTKPWTHSKKCWNKIREVAFAN